MNWLKVDESLPIIGKRVIVFTPLNDFKDVVLGKIQSITYYADVVKIEWVDMQDEPIEPTHWMSLPEPPKAD